VLSSVRFRSYARCSANFGSYAIVESPRERPGILESQKTPAHRQQPHDRGRFPRRGTGGFATERRTRQPHQNCHVSYLTAETCFDDRASTVTRATMIWLLMAAVASAASATAAYSQRKNEGQPLRSDEPRQLSPERLEDENELAGAPAGVPKGDSPAVPAEPATESRASALRTRSGKQRPPEAAVSDIRKKGKVRSSAGERPRYGGSAR
jgi:hypothetical protein